MAEDGLMGIQRDVLHGLATLLDAMNRLIDLYAPEQTELRPITLQVRCLRGETTDGPSHPAQR